MRLTSLIEPIRVAPDNEIRDLPTRRVFANVLFYGSVSILTAYSTSLADPGSWLWATMAVGAIATAIMAVPGAVEVLWRWTA
jgi:hypothetical protein